MIEARRNAGFERGFTGYVRWLVRRSFDAVWIRLQSPLPASGYVAVANHSSWWDGFVPYLLHRTLLPDTPFYLMMDERELRKFAFFRLAGAFSIDPGTPRDAYASVEYAASRVRSGGGVWMFPEGAIRAPSQAPIFSAGFVRAARPDAPIVPVAMRFAMLGGQRPTAYLAAGRPIHLLDRATPLLAQQIVSSLLHEIDAGIARAVVPHGFERFVEGRRGVDKIIAAMERALRRT